MKQCSTGNTEPDIIFLVKTFKFFQWLLNSSLRLVTKVSANKWNDKKSDKFLQDIFKFKIIFSQLKKIKVFRWLLKFTCLKFMTTLSQTIFDET